jgi:large subunit ribosomal protein L6
MNAVKGLTEGFSKALEIQGTGYKAIAKGEDLELSLGYSHQIKFSAPKGIKLEVKDQRLIVVSGADKYLVGQTAANIRRLREPDAYKGKGIRYQGEVIKLKPGKAAKAAGE